MRLQADFLLLKAYRFFLGYRTIAYVAERKEVVAASQLPAKGLQ